MPHICRRYGVGVTSIIYLASAEDALCTGHRGRNAEVLLIDVLLIKVTE